MKTAIKSLKIIKEMYEYFVKNYRTLEPKLMSCEKEDFEIIEKELNTFDIVKKKKVDVKELLFSDSLEEYNTNLMYEEDELTQNEYDFLKEMLLCD